MTREQLKGWIGAWGVLAITGLGSTARAEEPLKLSAFVEVFYAYDLDEPATGRRPAFLYNHGRHDAASLNLALLGASWEGRAARARLGLQAGTYPADNYAAEEPLLQGLFEASAGVRLGEGVWWDAGLFPSHIGFESAISTLNPTLTRSLQAENSPYYLAGARLTWEASEALTCVAVVANGWQTLREPVESPGKGGGFQLTLAPRAGLTLNWSTWASQEGRGEAAALRLFSDLYLQATWGRWTLSAGWDQGGQQDAQGEGWHLWSGLVVIARLEVVPQLHASARLERYDDPEGVLVAPDGAGVTLLGGSAGLDLEVAPDVMIRAELRSLRASRSIFGEGPDGARGNLALTTSLAAGF